MLIAFVMKTPIVIPGSVLCCVALSLFLDVGGGAFTRYAGLHLNPNSDCSHTSRPPFTIALPGFPIMQLLHRLNRLRCLIWMNALFTLIFAVAFGAACEILESPVVHLFGTHLRDGLDDTT